MRKKVWTPGQRLLKQFIHGKMEEIILANPRRYARTICRIADAKGVPFVHWMYSD